MKPNGTRNEDATGVGVDHDRSPEHGLTAEAAVGLRALPAARLLDVARGLITAAQYSDEVAHHVDQQIAAGLAQS